MYRIFGRRDRLADQSDDIDLVIVIVDVTRCYRIAKISGVVPGHAPWRDACRTCGRRH